MQQGNNSIPRLTLSNTYNRRPQPRALIPLVRGMQKRATLQSRFKKQEATLQQGIAITQATHKKRSKILHGSATMPTSTKEEFTLFFPLFSPLRVENYKLHHIYIITSFLSPKKPRYNGQNTHYPKTSQWLTQWTQPVKLEYKT